MAVECQRSAPFGVLDRKRSAPIAMGKSRSGNLDSRWRTNQEQARVSVPRLRKEAKSPTGGSEDSSKSQIRSEEGAVRASPVLRVPAAAKRRTWTSPFGHEAVPDAAVDDVEADRAGGREVVTIPDTVHAGPATKDCTQALEREPVVAGTSLTVGYPTPWLRERRSSPRASCGPRRRRRGSEG